VSEAVAAPIEEAPAHSDEFRRRRLANWLPLGVTYAAFYMGRYHFNVIKKDFGEVFHLDKTQVGSIATAAFWTYAVSVMFNGPLADRVGGRRAILLGSVGIIVINAIIGLLFWSGWQSNVLVGMSVLYSALMYFQSFGALSVVKVNSAWFHVRERGAQGGIFGIFISSGYALALALGGDIYAASKAHFGKGPKAFAPVFIVPSLVLATLFLINYLVVRDSPKHAGHADFHTGDATADEDPADQKAVDLGYVVKTILGHPVIRVIALAEFCTGFVRNGLLLYFFEYLTSVHKAQTGSEVLRWAGFAPTIGGIAGGLLCGYLSDKFFDSRRPPVAFIFYLGQIASLIVLTYAKSAGFAAFMVGVACTWVFGVHGMLSGTASADFGGKRAAASAAGLLDGVQYVGSGLTGFGLGWAIGKYGWTAWTWTIIPFSIAGALLMRLVWDAKPSRAGGH
jgi:OPA family glycerol-3-phosphate transporter-like MFS transporter